MKWASNVVSNTTHSNKLDPSRASSNNDDVLSTGDVALHFLEATFDLVCRPSLLGSHRKWLRCTGGNYQGLVGRLQSRQARIPSSYPVTAHHKRYFRKSLELVLNHDRGRFEIDNLLADQGVLTVGRENIRLFELVVNPFLPSRDNGSAETSDGPVGGRRGIDNHYSIIARKIGIELCSNGVAGSRSCDDDDVLHFVVN